MCLSEFVSEEEKEIMEMIKDYDLADKGSKITLDEILQNNISKKADK